ncbi:MAG: hypothetical protein IPG50_35160 [Myxococcales bacterium]|nr:hypothetical protein [Myxococcales bacterium]
MPRLTLAAAMASTLATLSMPAFADGAAGSDAPPRTPVEVVAAAPMRLDVDGRFVGTTPIQLMLLPKRYVLLARTADDDSAAVRLELDVREGEQRRVHLPAPARGGGGLVLVFVAAGVGALAAGALTAVLALR